MRRSGVVHGLRGDERRAALVLAGVLVASVLVCGALAAAGAAWVRVPGGAVAAATVVAGGRRAAARAA